MSQILINEYLKQLDVLKKVSGTNRESVVREAFKDLLKRWGRQQDLVFIPEHEIETPTKERRYVDGALLYELRLPFGYWEAKDEKDDLDAEIEYKFKRGYPKDNIIFEDTREAVLIQNGEEIIRSPVDDTKKLEKLLTLFFSYERKEIAAFRKAVEKFKQDLPAVLEALRAKVADAYKSNTAFRTAAAKFLVHAQDAINKSLVEADVFEMLIQHILTEEIFSKVFGEDDFHRQNNVAKELYALEERFFTGAIKKTTLKGLEPYYAAIRAAAAQIASHHEKQAFLKVIYENFYKVYNVKAADRLGVVYTPNEIVRFMIESADWLCEKHFGKNLIDKDVEILDPATGTGTFVTELLEHFRGQPAKLKHKYDNELHANEVAILPYYVANLNIEATYAAITGEYREFSNLCFVDTLDNVGLHTMRSGTSGDLFGSVSEENVVRIKRQNSKRISVIIGNPPYNANQASENDNNKNREYPSIDKRIKDTYIAESTAQKTKLYDMYARFFRWASDRIDANGIVAFVSNNSFIDSRTFDGFRKVIAQEFNEIWVVDLKGNARTSGERRRQEGGNVFDDQIRVGVAVWFCIKKRGSHGSRIYYDAVGSYAKADDKRVFLSAKAIAQRNFVQIRPNGKHDWLDLADNNFESLIPVANRDTKAAKTKARENAIFKLFSLGVVTARDDWMYDFDRIVLEKKAKFLIDVYNYERSLHGGHGATKAVVDALDYQIKWTRAVKSALGKNVAIKYDAAQITLANYRPFTSCFLYRDSVLNETGYQTPQLFGLPCRFVNPSITVMGDSSGKPYFCFAIDRIPDLNFVSPASGGTQTFPLYRYDDAGNREDNVTDWAVDQFKKHYKVGRGKQIKSITKQAIFHYVYGVLYDPIYREKYAQNLKREFPRVPFYADFWQWAEWGEKLMGLHIGFEKVKPFKLKRTDVTDEKARAAKLHPKSMLKADKEGGRILLDSETTLSGIPVEAWDYKLGNRSALEWILDQYKEKKPKDPTIREKFNTYCFADYKEKVIDLLMRVTTVSVETAAIVRAMKSASH